MDNQEALAFASYVNDVTHTMFVVFGKPVPPVDLIEWLGPMALDDNRRALLMHEEPLYVAADFLGIDRSASSFDQFEEKYQQIRAHYLYRGRTPTTIQATPHN